MTTHLNSGTTILAPTRRRGERLASSLPALA
jgi:hypothetical protein